MKPIKLFPALLLGFAITLAISACGNSGTTAAPANTTVTIKTDAGWVAFQDSAGTWIAATGTGTSSVKTYTTTAASTTSPVGVAYYCANTSTVKITQATVAEAGNGDQTPTMCAGSFTLSGTVSNVTTGDSVTIYVGNNNGWSGSSTPSIASGSGAYSISGVGEGTYDIAAVEINASGNVVKVLILRSQIVGSSNTIPINMQSAVAVVTTNTISATPPLGYATYANVKLVTANGTKLPLNNGGNYTVVPVATGGAASGDIYYFNVGAISGSSVVARGEYYAAVTDPGNKAIDLSLITPVTGTAASSITTGTNPTISGLSYTPSSTSPAVKAFAIALNSASVNYSVTISPGFLGTATTYTIPNFSSVTGWNSAWGLSSGSQYGFSRFAAMPNWSLSRSGGNVAGDIVDLAGTATFGILVTLKPTLF